MKYILFLLMVILLSSCSYTNHYYQSGSKQYYNSNPDKSRTDLNYRTKTTPKHDGVYRCVIEYDAEGNPYTVYIKQ